MAEVPSEITLDMIRETLYTAVICDALDQLGYRNQSPRLQLRSYTGCEKLVGRAKTTLWANMFHEDPSPYELELKAVDGCQPDDVMVCAAGGSMESGIWGELLSTAARNSGCVGVIVDGAVRDVTKMTEMGFPCFARATCMYDSANRQRVIDVDVPIELDGVRIEPGDLVMADADGVVFVPKKIETEAIQRAWEKVHAENITRDAIKNGMKATAAYENTASSKELPMRIGMVLTPLNEQNLTLAAQIGVTDVVARFPGESVEEVRAVREKIEAFGLKMSVIEGYLPMELAVRGLPGKDEQIARIQTLIRSMAAEGVPTLCYNFMHKLDWTRTGHEQKVRGGALVTGFDLSAMPEEPMPAVDSSTTDRWWENLEYFLKQVLPVAEEVGVKLAMHPDDPPGLSTLHGYPRIMGQIENFERLVNLVPSPANGIAFCQGCFSEMGLDVPAAIRRLGPHIFYVHFRDVEGCSPKFHETFHDCGQTNMPEAMRAYRDIGFDGVMRPDHVPLLASETGDNTGYSMQGRLFAVGYMRGLIQAVESEKR